MALSNQQLQDLITTLQKRVSNLASGTADMILASVQTVTGAKTFLDGKMILRNVANTFSGVFTNTNTANRTYTLPDSSGTVVLGGGTATGTNTGDNAVNTLYSGLVTNATHTGDATGSGALAVVGINGTLLSSLATGILKNTTGTGVPSIAVNSDLPVMSATVGGAVPTPPNNTTTFLRGDGTFAAPTGGSGDVVGDDVSVTVQNIVAYNAVGGKNITELTGTQGDVLYHNGTIWAKLPAGVSGRFLKTQGAGANPLWDTPAGGSGISLGLAVAAINGYNLQ